MLDLVRAAEILAMPVMPEHPALRFRKRLLNFIEGEYQINPSHVEWRAPGLHISGLYKICARKAAFLHDLEQIHLADEDPDFIEVEAAGQALTADFGKFLHYWYQERYLGPAGLLRGPWHCVRCDKLLTYKLMPTKCPLCGGHYKDVIQYKEYGTAVKFKNGMVAVGSVDGVFVDHDWWGSDDLPKRELILELKSLSSSRYKNLKKPFFSHVIQAHGYMHGMDIKEALIVYFDRGVQCDWDFKGPEPKAGEIHQKEFYIPFNDELWQMVEDQVEDYGKVLKAIENGKKVDPADYEPICDIKSCEAASRCPVKEECFEV